MNKFFGQIFGKIRNLKVLIVGDAILDKYVYGDVYRISPEAPVPVINHYKDTYTLGGAANVARNITSLGASASICSVAGADTEAAMLKKILGDWKISMPDTFFGPGARTITKTRIVIRKQQFCRIDYEDAPEKYRLSEKMEEELFRMAQDADLIIVSDYAKGVVTEELLQKLIDFSKTRGILVAMDPKPDRELEFKGVGLITPNKSEAYKLANLKERFHEEFPAEKICSIIYEKYRPENLIITLGPDGMLISREGRVIKMKPTRARKVFDVSGAGDTVIATVSMALAAGATLDEATELGNVAAGIVVGKFGTDVTTEGEIMEYLNCGH